MVLYSRLFLRKRTFFTPPFFGEKGDCDCLNAKTLDQAAEGFWFSEGSETAYVVGTDWIVFSTRETIL